MRVRARVCLCAPKGRGEGARGAPVTGSDESPPLNGTESQRAATSRHRPPEASRFSPGEEPSRQGPESEAGGASAGGAGGAAGGGEQTFEMSTCRGSRSLELDARLSAAMTNARARDVLIRLLTCTRPSACGSSRWRRRRRCASSGLDGSVWCF